MIINRLRDNNKFMINCSPKIIRSRNNDLNDSVSEESVRRTTKKLQRTNSNKSNRSIDSCESKDSTAITSFYVKNVFLSQLHDINKNHQDHDQPQTNKKVRNPTPCKSRKELNRNTPQTTHNDNLKVKTIQFNLKLGELQTKLKDSNNKNRRLENQVKNLTEKVGKLQGQINQKQKKISTLINQNLQEKKRIFDLERCILENQTNLKYANNNLDRLKKAINQNKVADLKKQNADIKRENENLLNNLAELSSDLMKKQQVNIKLQKQNMMLKNRIEMEKNCKNQSMKEKFLQRQVKKLKQEVKEQKNYDQLIFHQNTKILEQQKHSLQGEVKKLRIELDYLQRKHTEQLKLFCKTKNQEVLIFQTKYAELHKKYKDFKEQIKDKTQSKLSKLRQNNNLLKPQTCLRENLLEVDNTRRRKNSILFELSPQ